MGVSVVNYGTCHTELLLLDIKSFLSHPIPISPFLTKKLFLRLLKEIAVDVKSILDFLASKVIFIHNILWFIPSIHHKRIQAFAVLFVLACLSLPFLIIITIRILKRNIHISLLILVIFIFIYIFIKFKYIRGDCEQKIILWKDIIQQKEYEVETLENQIRESQIYNLIDLEDQVKIWLEEDKLNLIEKGLNKLKIEIVDRDPILSFIGISSSEISDSHILITDREMEEVNKKYQTLLIDEKDFYKEKGVEGKYKYGIYECFVIFLGETFLSYYRCYWNFVKGDYVDEETCEYLYYSIVSVKTRERSSLKLQNSDEKRKYTDWLSLTTMDGKIVYFQMSDDRKQKINSNNRKISNYVSDINQAAARIRYWLRQKRVDYQRTKGTD